MLILAGVSINAIVGEDGILTKAKNASIASRKAAIMEELNLELASYNIDSILKSPEQTTTMLGNLISKGLIDTVLSSSEEYLAEATNPMGIPQFDDANNYTGYIDYAVKKEDYSIIISIDDSGIYKAEYGNVTISAGGSVAGGTTLVTDKAFTNNEGASAEEQGKFVIDNDASVMFVDEINGELSIQVKSGTHAKVYAFKDMTLTNSGIKRSAIDIEPGGTLDLYVAEGVTVTVNSGYGGYSVPATSNNFLAKEGVIGGNGAFAGIHVPHYDYDTTIKKVILTENGEISRSDGINADFTTINYKSGDAILNLSGKGVLYAYGGDAGDGGNGGYNNLDWGAGAGGGAGAGIGGNGGNGAAGLSHYTGTAGDKGEDCGIINISNTLTVYAYGGSGGSGGGNTKPSGDQVQSGGGGGGYPAAGIGGGGAGGASGDTHVAGAGFSSPIPESTFVNEGGVNGMYLDIPMSTVGGAYYGSFANSDKAAGNQTTLFPYRACKEISNGNGYSGGIGGGCCVQSAFTKGAFQQNITDSFIQNDNWPDGGIAGKGGKIKVSENAKIYAFNGSYITTKDSSTMTQNERESTQALIYAQAGYDVKAIRRLCEVKIVLARNIADLVSEWSTVTNNYVSYRTIKSPYDTSCGEMYGRYILGIGSGAGSAQTIDGNGTYTVDASMN